MSPLHASIHESSGDTILTRHLGWERHESSDADEQALLLRGWDQCYDQISPGAHCGVTVNAYLDDLQLFREFSSTALRQRGRAPNGTHTLAIRIDDGGDARFRGSTLTPHSLLTMGEDVDLDLRTSRSFEAFGLTVCSDVLRRHAETVEGRHLIDRLDRRDVIPLASTLAEELRLFLASVFDHLESHHSVLAHENARLALQAEVLDRVLAVLRSTEAEAVGQSTAQQRARIVARAEEFVLSRPFESVTVADLCFHVGTSRRRLQYAFQEVMGTSPNRYLRAIRLCRVRRELKAGGASVPSIQDTAARWGFWHLGHFSLDYKRMFAERPSDTVRGAVAANSRRFMAPTPDGRSSGQAADAA